MMFWIITETSKVTAITITAASTTTMLFNKQRLYRLNEEKLMLSKGEKVLLFSVMEF